MTLAPDQQRRVLDTALQLFAAHELKDITLEQLSHASGVPAFEILRQYQSPENILRAVLERELELMAAAAHSPELRLPGETLRDELQVLAGIILEEYRQRLPFLRRLLAEAISNPEIGALFYRTFIVQGRMLFAEFLKARKQFGELRDDVDTEASAAMFLAGLTGILLVVEVFGGNQIETMEDERVVEVMSDVFLNGVVKR